MNKNLCFVNAIKALQSQVSAEIGESASFPGLGGSASGPPRTGSSHDTVPAPEIALDSCLWDSETQHSPVLSLIPISSSHGLDVENALITYEKTNKKMHLGSFALLFSLNVSCISEQVCHPTSSYKRTLGGSHLCLLGEGGSRRQKTIGPAFSVPPAHPLYSPHHSLLCREQKRSEE